MRYRQGFSRRHMLAVTAAAGGIAAAGFGGRFGVVSGAAAQAQAANRIDQFDPALDNIISTSEPIKELASGLGGPLVPGQRPHAEGPVWWKEGGYLLFSDINASRRMRYTPGQGVSVFKEHTNQANGLTRDLQGRLVACEGETRRVTRQEADGSITVIANSFQGQRLNRPNDVVVKSDGSIYFTDPWTNPDIRQQWDMTFMGVYRVSPDLGTMTLLVGDFPLPNGLAFSPDESVLYINDSIRRHIRAFALAPNGTLARQTDRVFADLSGSEPGVPDGMKVDVAGNVYSGGSGGIYILDPKGKKLGRIVHGYRATTNIAFGGDDWKTLFFTTGNTLGSVNLKIAGLPVPAPKKS
jgi:gluconolactonase